MRWSSRALCANALFLLAVAGFGFAAEAETWRPAAHPAVLEHEVPGVTRPLRSLDLAAEIGGRVQAMPLAEGAVVGDEDDGWGLALTIDPRLAELARDAATAALREAEAGLVTAQAQRDLAAREAAYQATELARIERLIADGRLSQRDLDAASFQADRAQLAVDSAAASAGAAEAAIATARARLAEAEERVARHRILAPAGWVVAERLVEPGAVVQPGTPLLRLHDVTTLEIALRLSEDEIAALGQGVTLRFPAFDTEVEATVARIDVGYDQTSRKRLALLHVPGDAAPVASGGLVVTARLRVPVGADSVLVPDRFLIRGRQRSYVELVDGTRVAVVPLREDDGMLVLAGDALGADAELRLPRDAVR